jgi:pycsar effector protein
VWWRPERRRRSDHAQPPERRNDPKVSDVEFLIGQTGDWIRSADTKAGLLLGALTVLLGWLSSSAGSLRGLWSGHPQRLGALVFLATCVVLLVVAIALLIAVLIPRRSTPAATRYAWPWVHRTSLEDLKALTPDTQRTEAWRQAKLLAGIASRKHTLFAAAVWFSAGSTACFLAWSVLRS